MFVEVYVPHYIYEPGVTTNVSRDPDTIKSLTKVINVDAIRTISLVPTVISGKNYYLISLTKDIMDDIRIDRIYITESDWERLLH